MHNHAPQNYDCPFCIFAQGGETELNKRGDIVFEDNDVLAFISPKKWLRNPGHVLVIPKHHVENIYDISDQTLSQVYIVGKKVAIALKELTACDGVSMRQHNEPSGDQDVFHFHLHVFPRYENDQLYPNGNQYELISQVEKDELVRKLKNRV